MSELYGRSLPIVIANFGFGVFATAIATAANVQTVMICRFFDDLFGSCPLTVVAAIFADIYSNENRGLAVAAFSATVFMGPMLAPFVGGFFTISYLGWRWTEYISSFMGFSAFILALFFLDETYPPLILVGKAAELRILTKNWGIHAKQEEIEVDLKELVVKNVGRPLRILFTEPIVLVVSIYMAFIYGILYTFLTAYALVSQGVYGMNPGVGGLPYFGLVTSEIIAFIIIVLMNPSYVKKLKANNNIPVPEWRLPLVMVGAPVFAQCWSQYEQYDIA
jgi:DHA1 family multidrug resistance protein-like MFS transporter